METFSLTTAGADGNPIQLTSVPVELQAGTDVTIGISSEHLKKTDTDNADIFATVTFAEQPGGETYLYCSADGIDQLTVHQLG